MRAWDQILWESTVRGEAFWETKSDSLGVHPRVFTARLVSPTCEAQLIFGLTSPDRSILASAA